MGNQNARVRPQVLHGLLSAVERVAIGARKSIMVARLGWTIACLQFVDTGLGKVRRKYAAGI